MANFFTTHVRYIFRSLPKLGDALRGLATALQATRVLALRLSTPLLALVIVATVGAVHMSAITSRAQMKQTTAGIIDALDLSEIAKHRGDR